MDRKTIKHYRDRLARLIARADALAESDDRAARRALALELQQFIEDTPRPVPGQPETAEFEEMDDIALRTHEALLLANIQDRVSAIAQRSAELASLAKRFAAQAEANEQAAKTLRLEKATAVVKSLTESIAAMKELKAQLEQAPADDDALTALARQLGKALQSLQDIRAAVESKA